LLPFDFSFEWFEKPEFPAVTWIQATTALNQTQQIKTYTLKKSFLFVDK